MVKIMPGLDSVKKIGVLRDGVLGEFFLTYPALAALREHYPEAEIVLFGGSWHKSFLAAHPELVNRVEVVPAYAPYDTRREEPEVKKFVARIAREKFDLFLQLQDGGLHSNPFILDMTPKMSAGFATIEAEPLDISLPYIVHQHEVLRALELLEAIGIKDYTLEPRFPIKRQDHTEYSEFYKPDGRDLVVLHPGANDPRRQWPPEFFGEVGDWLVEQGYRVVVTSSIVEYTIAESVLYTMKQPAEALVGVLSLPALAALLSKARLVISNDTGPLHIARAVGTPTIGLYWALNIMHTGPLFQRSHRALISWQMKCPVCGAADLFDTWPSPMPTASGCKHERSMLEDISPESVTDTAEILLLETMPTFSV